MRFSLITGTKGAATGLPRLLASLVDQERDRFELVVVDQNDDDRIERMLAPFRERLTIRHLRSAPGLSIARNTALRQVRSEGVAFPDDDCWYAPDTLRRAVELFRAHPHLDFVTGRTVDAQGRDSVSSFPAGEVDVTYHNALQAGNSNCLFLRRSVFDVVGGLDERLGVGARTPFQSGDETDYLLRCVAHGLKGRFFPDLLIFHEQTTTKLSVGELSRSYAYALGFGAMLRKHRYPLPYVARRVVRPATGALVSLVRGHGLMARKRWGKAFGVARGYWWWDRLADSLPDPEASDLRSAGAVRAALPQARFQPAGGGSRPAAAP